MLKKTLISLATLAVLATGSATAASAGSYGHGHGYKSYGYDDYDGYKRHCRWMKKKILVGYDYYGEPIYKWRRFKVCH
ncbi:hypothetical protein [Jiella sonneratiae]|uniref:Sulfur globule protein n=1 Tax=Jiella sonneratiae TaxID=2816856 RepID=A0ABS3J347_9HYPH|nr:hypothetical protein [Jiella sonneratiae]MBO0904096.1 hypothetical protein [Jiella sonneratiae]